MTRYTTAKWVIATLAIIASVQGGWVHAKALLAQHLLQQAWTRTVVSGHAQKPWPWADTYAVLHLHVPRLDQDLIVLEGTSGEAMAFGPARVTSGDSEGDTTQATVIGGHRDTHLQFLSQLETGDDLVLNRADGSSQRYQLTDTFIADVMTDQLQVDVHQDALILITCYPFDALASGGRLRFIAIATPVAKPPLKLRAQRARGVIRS
ncbi:MAG TPA: class GN sortase [Gammaproteobacteria bacterium]|jgi:sortase A|nr:class GN sortase [Gammaproteobacteria bacterium]